MLVTEFLDALPKEPTIADQTMVAIRALGRLPKRRKNPVGDAQIAENKLARTMVRLNKEKTTAQTQRKTAREVKRSPSHARSGRKRRNGGSKTHTKRRYSWHGARTALSRSAPAEAHPRERNGSITTSAGVAHSRGALPAMGTGANVKCRQRCTHLALVLARTTNSS